MTILKRLPKKETRGGQREMLYTETYKTLLLVSMKQLNRNGHALLRYEAGEELIPNPDDTFLKVARTSPM